MEVDSVKFVEIKMKHLIASKVLTSNILAGNVAKLIIPKDSGGTSITIVYINMKNRLSVEAAPGEFTAINENGHQTDVELFGIIILS